MHINRCINVVYISVRTDNPSRNWKKHPVRQGKYLPFTFAELLHFALLLTLKNEAELLAVSVSHKTGVWRVHKLQNSPVSVLLTIFRSVLCLFGLAGIMFSSWVVEMVNYLNTKLSQYFILWQPTDSPNKQLSEEKQKEPNDVSCIISTSLPLFLCISISLWIF